MMKCRKKYGTRLPNSSCGFEREREIKTVISDTSICQNYLNDTKPKVSLDISHQASLLFLVLGGSSKTRGLEVKHRLCPVQILPTTVQPRPTPCLCGAVCFYDNNLCGSDFPLLTLELGGGVRLDRRWCFVCGVG